MRLSCWWLSTFVLLAASPLLAQQGTYTPLPQPTVLCDLPPGPAVPSGHAHYEKLALLPRKSANVTIEFLEAGDGLSGKPCVSFPTEARSAMEQAAAIWSEALGNERTINIRSCFSNDFTDGTLASASAQLYQVTGERALGEDALLYPQATIKQLLGDLDTDAPDMRIVFNNQKAFFYGSDPFDNPNRSFYYDFITLALHEMGHGLGFSGIANYSPRNSTIGRRGKTGPDGQPTLIPTVFDHAVTLGDRAPLAITKLPPRSATLDNALLGREDGLFFDRSRIGRYTAENQRYKLYSPDPYERGSSYNHFDDSRQLMHHTLGLGTFHRSVGQSAAVLRTLGWAGEAQVAAPVTLTSFTGRARQQDVTLTWATASETENAGFTIAHSRDGHAFADIGKVGGHGTTTVAQTYTFTHADPGGGLHYYRLRQTDFDGSEERSTVVAVTMTGREQVLDGPFPNPTQGAASVRLTYHSRDTRTVTVRLYTTAGRLVHEQRQIIDSGATPLTIDLQDLTPGVYVLQLVDGSGVQSRKLRVE